MSQLHLFALLVLTTGLSGCVLNEGGEPTDCSRFEDGPEVYRYRYPGDDVAMAGGTYGFIVKLTNPFDEYMRVGVTADVPGEVGGFEVSMKPGETPTTDPFSGGSTSVSLWQDGGEGLVAFSATLPASLGPGATQFRLAFQTSMWSYNDNRSVWDKDSPFCQVDAEHVDEWEVRIMADSERVSAGDKVQTLTAGLWLNGTSFYTNIKELNDDPDFPAGYDRDQFGGDPLPVYVYGSDRSQQPVGNRDRCWFTTITGYNDLLKTQQELGTNLRLLLPEEGYTVAGAEDHFLYGESLIFLNTIVSHEGTATPDEQSPDPTGACFDHRNACRKQPSITGTCMEYVPPPPRVPPAER